LKSAAGLPYHAEPPLTPLPFLFCKIHSCRIKGGKVFYANRWVKTNRYKQEDAAGWASHLKIGDMQGSTGLLALLLGKAKEIAGLTGPRRSGGSGTANTAMAFHAGRLLALHEGDLPYAVNVLCDGIIETAGRLVFEGQTSFTAHPKIDPATGHMHFFGYHLEAPPYCTYAEVDAEGNLIKSVPITVSKPVMMHDFAITEHYAIILDTPVVFDPKIMVKEGKLPFAFDLDHGLRFGLRRFDAPDDGGEAVRWFEVPSCMLTHVANAWEDGAKVHVVGSVIKYWDLNLLAGKKSDIPLDDLLPHLTHFVLNLEDGTVKTSVLSKCYVEFPQIDQRLCGRRSRFAYCAEMDEECVRTGSLDKVAFGSLAKIDMHKEGIEAGPQGDALAGRIPLGPGRSCGEPIFVPREAAKSEDDGYLLTYVYDEAAKTSDLLVFDALSMDPKPLAKALLPQRVPNGFHALFVSEKQLQQQRR